MNRRVAVLRAPVARRGGESMRLQIMVIFSAGSVQDINMRDDLFA